MNQKLVKSQRCEALQGLVHVAGGLMTDLRGRLVIVDNYDSFVHVLAGYCSLLGVQPIVVRNDSVSVGELAHAKAVLISPGPGAPGEAGVCVEAVKSLDRVPILGVCLGHQAIGEAFGARVDRTPPMHGRQSFVEHGGDGLFEGLPSPLALTRYHSLAVFDLPDCLRVDATSSDGVIMAISHVSRPIWGLQPHPESVLSECGLSLVANFLKLAGFRVCVPAEAREDVSRHGHSARGEAADFFAEPIQSSYPLPRPPSSSRS